MEEYLNSGIKTVIEKFPQVGGVLDEYGIGCGPCSVGTCLFKDIVKIHSLPFDEEREMMQKIIRVIYPDQEIRIPETERKKDVQAKPLNFSPPIKALVDEHVLIKRWLALIPSILKDLDLEKKEDRALILQGVDFIRSYADRFHHAKEEDILFDYFDKSQEILKVMYQDHIQGRALVKALVEAVEQKNKAGAVENLLAYRQLLTQHIHKEDEILYPWMEKNLSLTQIGELFSRFQQTDERMGSGTAKFEDFITNLEAKYQK